MVKHKTLLKNMKTPCICNGDREERHPNFTFSVTSLMLCNLLGRFSLLLQLEYTKCDPPPSTRTHTMCCSTALDICITLSPRIHLHHQTVSYEEETYFFNRTKTFMWLFSHNMEPHCCLFLHYLLVQSSVPSCCLPTT